MALPTPRPLTRATRFVRHHSREGVPIELIPYCVPPNLEEKVIAGVLSCARSRRVCLSLRRRSRRQPMVSHTNVDALPLPDEAFVYVFVFLFVRVSL
jgi:hypothetical protein